MQKSNVLIVDDAQINRELLEFILQDHYQVFQAENGSQAIEMKYLIVIRYFRQRTAHRQLR